MATATKARANGKAKKAIVSDIRFDKIVGELIGSGDAVAEVLCDAATISNKLGGSLKIVPGMKCIATRDDDGFEDGVIEAVTAYGAFIRWSDGKVSGSPWSEISVDVVND
jgi:hypothetical protein